MKSRADFVRLAHLFIKGIDLTNGVHDVILEFIRHHLSAQRIGDVPKPLFVIF